MNTDQKLDKLVKTVSELKKLHDFSHNDLEGKLQKLEADVAVSQELQEDATEIEFKPLDRVNAGAKPCCKLHNGSITRHHNRGHQLEERMLSTT